MIAYGLMILVAYLVGSIASAVLVCKMLGKEDPRSQGSMNPGATNVLRLHGKKAAALTLAGDAAKGFVPVLAVKLLGSPDPVIALTALAAFLGHLYPLFFQFRGGKGVATFVGVLFAMHWGLGLGFALTWLLMAFIFRYSSLAALTAACLAPLVSLWFYPSAAIIASNSVMAVLLLWRHRSNISNLVNGRENKLGSKKAG